MKGNNNDTAKNEDLTKSRVELFRKATEKLGLRKVWTEGGKILTISNNIVAHIENKVLNTIET